MSDNETDNLPLSKLRDIERYKNAERMARALRPYLPNQDDQAASRSASRGRTKDKRICQLSAAFKYCSHLEKGLKDAYEKCGNVLGPLTDDYKLLSNSLLSSNNNNHVNLTQNNNNNIENNLVDLSTMNNTETQLSINNSCFKLSDALDDDAENFYLSPNQNHQNNASIHESSTISATNGAANQINKKTINSNTSKKTINEECAKLRTVNNLRNFDHVDTSPILSCYLDENVDENNNKIVEDNNSNKRKRRFVDINNKEESSSQKLVHTTTTPATSLAAATKRLLIDSANNNNKENSIIQSQNESNLSLTTPKAASKNVGAGKKNKLNPPPAFLSSTLTFSTPTPVNTTMNKLDDTTKSEPNMAVFNDETTNGNGEFRKVYFLRSSTTRLRNLLNANNTATTLPSSASRGNKSRNTTTATTISASITAHKLINTGNNIALNKLNKIDSSTASSRSSSLTTTPSVRANDTSTSSHELNMDNLDHNNNITRNHNKMFDDHQSKNGFDFV